MSEAKPDSVRKMPRGVRKGGTRFPRYSLEDTLVWSKKLVAKTHSSPQPQDVVYSGVVGSKSGTGDVKISTLKQYGLMGGRSAAYTATDLAKKIDAAPEDERGPLLKEAALTPSVFKLIFETFQPDTVSKAKIRQRASDLGVHPEETETCAEIYASSLATAGLVSVDGDQIKHSSSIALTAPPITDGADKEDEREEELNTEGDPNKGGEIQDDEVDLGGAPAPRAIFNVNVTLDSSLDTEKLAKQLQILKRYGAI